MLHLLFDFIETSLDLFDDLILPEVNEVRHELLVYLRELNDRTECVVRLHEQLVVYTNVILVAVAREVFLQLRDLI